MTLSKKNNDKLKSYLKKNLEHKKSNSNIIDEIFYSIIDNELDIKEIDTIKDILKDNDKKSISMNQVSDNAENNQLSEEDLLYDEFNYLLDE